MKIKVITTDKEFDSVKNEWMDFEKKVDNKNITSSYVWQRTWWGHFKDYEKRNFGYEKKLCILFLYTKENVLRAIAPFCEVTRKSRGVKCKTIEFIASQWGATYLDIITDRLSEEEYNFIFSWLKKNRKYDLIELRYIPEFSPNLNLYKSKGSTTVLSGCPEIKIKNYKTINHYIQQEHSKSLRQNLRTAKNRMKRENANYHEEISDIISNAEFEEIKRTSRSKLLDNKHCVYDNRQKEMFLKDIYCNSGFSCNIIKIILNNRLASYRINILYSQYKYCFDASYDRTYRHYGLGSLSVNLNIEDSFERKLLVHCMGTGVDFYKLRFTKRVVKIYTFLGKGNSLKGMLFYFLKKKLNQKIASVLAKELKANLNFK